MRVIIICLLLIAGKAMAQQELIVGLKNGEEGNRIRENWNGKERLSAFLGADYQVNPVCSMERIERLRTRVRTEEGKNALERLAETYRITWAGNEEVTALIERLKKENYVRYVELKNTVPPPPPVDIPPTTPVIENNQTWLNADPGLNVKALWNRGIKGQGIVLNDVEYGYNRKHEDLNGLKIARISDYEQPAEMTYAYWEHGTSALGISAAGDNGYGTTGMANQLKKAQLFPEWTTAGINRVDAILHAIDSTEAGHVILLEMQTYGNLNYCPAEYDQGVWDATKLASELGIIVVAAAGNGNEDLDSDFYTEYRSRGSSGAIMVGAGSATVSHAKKGFSTFGNRVDIQGWGESVLSPGYGSYAKYGGDTNQYYGMFSGTSSGSALIAGCAVLLQSHFNQKTGDFMTRDQLLKALQTGAYKQSDSATNGNVGRLPNLANAVLKVDEYITEWMNQNSTLDQAAMQQRLYVYPNPGTETIEWVTYNNGTTEEVRIIDFTGKVVSLSRGETSVDVADLDAGIYTIQVIQNGQLLSTKWTKISR